MKCPNCDGKGVVHVRNIHAICGKCKGFGWIDEPQKKPLTNEEWLKSKDTADLAEWIYNAMFNKSCQEDVEDGAYMQMMTKKDYIESWLMETHNE